MNLAETLDTIATRITVDGILEVLENLSLPRGEYIRISIYTDISGTIYHVPYDGDDEEIAGFNNMDELRSAAQATVRHFWRE